MPELPEIETIRKSFDKIKNTIILDVEFRREDIIRQKDYSPEKIPQKQIIDINRRGKFLIIVLEKNMYIILHMGMSGRCYIMNVDANIAESHVHLVVTLNNKTKIVYQDPRRFGGVWLVKDMEGFFSHIGKEPLSDEFTANYLYELTRKRKTPIKNLLLNQRLIAGIGNIYADEALYMAEVRPNRPANTLTKKEAQKLRNAIRKVLNTSIENRGTTFRDFRDGYNESGHFQNYLKVYGKTNEPCPVCTQILTREKIGGRTSHYCDNCQN
ncbi:Formamidopyrimidine-DNA glycosylase [Candidatus Syntrophocurvum alkaliphilum]|uniref:Formamidopyrimidine-DNA glycosylase n=1 Tax=Candidatus Syntrophocurvum alkaliphilum TaxID=2293317 RepID=A0A6I6DDG5_9FIRM|nr:bifunctional DNA-formamidopyrimidine glycosylase/DNA-(apurinic or apyrimidinic site) lyase [Candidatus Syntrophocurvum alkaliphilum]QGU00180.1 Formamidopyrimidine-DNA glycosylase [Candidatus Syntrophocurvum alkaliphilum]